MQFACAPSLEEGYHRDRLLVELRVLERLHAAECGLCHVLAPLAEQQLDELLVDLLDLPARRVGEIVLGEVDAKLRARVAYLAHLQEREGEVFGRHGYRRWA